MMTPRSCESTFTESISVTPIYPTGGQYREAIQNPAACFKDPDLANGKPKSDPLGLPKPISGNFASVFTIDGADGKRWAVKCFTRYPTDQHTRYKEISQTLSAINRPWRVPFDYITEGILCLGKWYPILKMEWVDAKGLIPYIEAHLWQPSVLAELANEFAQMIKDMGACGIAHGDLQHGNLLVTPNGELKLIDYDGMYVAGLDRLGASEIGHTNYQSPTRSMENWGPDLDRFSSWVIYGSLVAITIDPILWTLLHSEGDEALLFRKDDFLPPQNSRALVLLSQSPDERLRHLSKALAPFWTNDLTSIPALDTMAVPAPNSERPLSISHKADSSKVEGARNDVSKAISDWLTSLDSASLGTTDSPNDSTWILAQLPPIERLRFEPSHQTLRIFGATILLALVALVVLGALAIITVTDAVIGGACLATLLFAISGVLYYRTAEAQGKRDSRTQLARRNLAVNSARRLASKSEKDRRAIDQRERQAIAKIDKRAKDAYATEQKQLAAAETKAKQQLSNISTQVQSLQSSESVEFGKELQILQNQHVAAKLRIASIQSATMPGIGQLLKLELEAHGIMTAADFTGISIGTDSKAFINLRNGHRVHPNGIGEIKALTLDAWRRDVEESARRTQPTILPQMQAQAIRVKYAQKRQSLAEAERKVRAEAMSQQHQLRESWAATHLAIGVELTETRDRFLRECAQADLSLSQDRQNARDATWQQVKAEWDHGRYSEVTYRRYCICIARG